MANTQSLFDEEYVKKAIKSAGKDNEEQARRIINKLTESISLPAKEIVMVCERYRRAIEDTLNEADTKDKDIQKTKYMLVSSFVCTIIGNLMGLFDIAPEDLRKYCESSISQTLNMQKQQKEQEK